MEVWLSCVEAVVESLLRMVDDELLEDDGEAGVRSSCHSSVDPVCVEEGNHEVHHDHAEA